jgi:hypothetical protein
LVTHEGFEYWEFMPRVGPDEPSGRDWEGERHTLFKELRTGKFSERRLWELRRIARRAPAYALLIVLTGSVLGVEDLLNRSGTARGWLLTVQKRLRSPGKWIFVPKFRTLPASERQRPVGPGTAKLATFLARIVRSMSLDEILQILSILWGGMSYVGPRPLLTADRDLMAPPVLTLAERAYWLRIPRPGIWTPHYPGSRNLPPGSPEFLRTRFLSDVVTDKIISRPFVEWYLDNVVGPYLRGQGRQGLEEARALLLETLDVLLKRQP